MPDLNINSPKSQYLCGFLDFLFIYRKLREIRAISRSGGMNPPSLSLAGRDEALLVSATRRNAFLIIYRKLRKAQFHAPAK
jgi:hypothetical protein